LHYKLIKAKEIFDGAGVKIFRSIGQTKELTIDPILMLDEFCSDNPDDYLQGFPPHPHRGFETFTYMLDGKLKHEDSLGNKGTLEKGQIQWMTAGRGIIHSEMPIQKDGLMRGFQLWLNLPASKKMCSPKYKDIDTQNAPTVTMGCLAIKVIAGAFGSTYGQINTLETALDYFDITTKTGEELLLLKEQKVYFLYLYDGEISVNGIRLTKSSGIYIEKHSKVRLICSKSSRLLFLGAAPLNEPIIQHGPFVMNTKDEIKKTIEDFNDGKFGRL
jgi:redox-sensitive bicupin YhaK (pirin superfamily)